MKDLIVTLNNDIPADTAHRIMEHIAMIKGVWGVSPGPVSRELDHEVTTAQEAMNVISREIKTRERYLIESGARRNVVMKIESPIEEYLSWREMEPSGKWRIAYTGEGIHRPLIEMPFPVRRRLVDMLPDLCSLVLRGGTDDE